MPDAPFPEHSIRYLEMAFRSDRHRRQERPSGRGFRRGACGDSIEVHLGVRGGRVHEVTFQVQGCMNTMACANALAELAEGLTVDAAWSLNPEAVVGFLESLPPDHFHCAELVVGAFYRALADYGRQGGPSWKSAYRTGCR